MVRMSMKYQRWLQSLLDDVGRGDIGVGNVELSLPRLLFTLHKGPSTLEACLPVSALADRRHGRGRWSAIFGRSNRNGWTTPKGKVRERNKRRNHRKEVGG